MLTEGEMDLLKRFFTDTVSFSRHLNMRVESADEGNAELYVDIEDYHLNGNGTLHGGVYATLIDNSMALAVTSMAAVRTATTQMNVHFLGPVSTGRITCRAEVLHRTRRTATAEARVYDEARNMVAMGTGSFRIFEQRGNPIV